MTKLRPSQDAYGQAMLDSYMGKDGAALIIERDDGYVDNDFPVAGYLQSSPRFWSPLDQTAIRRVRGRVLVVGCVRAGTRFISSNLVRASWDRRVTTCDPYQPPSWPQKRTSLLDVRTIANTRPL